MIYMALTTRESETILPLFLSYSVSSFSLLFGIEIYKTFYRSRDCWHLGWVTIMSFRGLKVSRSKFSRTRSFRPLEKWTVSHELRWKKLSGSWAHSFPRASLSENCSLLGTDNVRRQISVHILAPNEGYCLFS